MFFESQRICIFENFKSNPHKETGWVTGLKDHMSYHVSHLPSPCLIPFSSCVLNPDGWAEQEVAMAEGVVGKTLGGPPGTAPELVPRRDFRAATVAKRAGKRVGLVLRLHLPAGTLFLLRLHITGP